VGVTTIVAKSAIAFREEFAWKILRGLSLPGTTTPTKSTLVTSSTKSTLVTSSTESTLLLVTSSTKSTSTKW
jgi:hypothetical protein